MVSLGEYISAQILPFLFVIAACTAANWFTVKGLLFANRKQPGNARVFAASLLIGLLELLPLYVAFYLYYPGALADFAYALLIIPIPPIALVYYAVYRRVLKINGYVAMTSVELLIVAQYLSRTMYSFFVTAWTGILGDGAYSNQFFFADIPAAICATLVMAVLRWFFAWLVSRQNGYLEFPYNYPAKKPLRAGLSVMLAVAGPYTLLVCFRMLEVRQYRMPLTLLCTLEYSYLLFLLSYVLINRYRKDRQQALEWQAKETEAYVNSLLRTTDEFRQVKHDFNNVLQMYQGYLAIGDIEGLKRYHGSLVKMTTQAGSRLDLVRALKDRTPIYTLFTVKSQLATEKGVEMSFEAVSLLVDATMNDLDLCRVLANLLDNAIDAAVESEGKWIQVRCERKPGGMLDVIIANSVLRRVPLDRLFDAGYTTKESHSGHGLCAVKSIVGLHQRCGLFVDCDDEKFTARLLLEKA